MKWFQCFDVLFLMGILFSGSVCAQGRNAVKFNLLSPLVQTTSFFYEREFTKEQGKVYGIQLGLNYTNFSVGHAKYEGFGWTPEARIYPFESSDFKVYLAPFAVYQKADLEVTTYDANSVESVDHANFSKLGGGIVFGGKYLFKNIAILDIFLGPAYVSDNIDVESGQEENFAHFDLAIGTLSGYGLRAGIAVGLAF